MSVTANVVAGLIANAANHIERRPTRRTVETDRVSAHFRTNRHRNRALGGRAVTLAESALLLPSAGPTMKALAYERTGESRASIPPAGSPPMCGDTQEVRMRRPGYPASILFDAASLSLLCLPRRSLRRPLSFALTGPSVNDLAGTAPQADSLTLWTRNLAPAARAWTASSVGTALAPRMRKGDPIESAAAGSV